MIQKINSILENIAKTWIRQLPLFVMLVLYTTLPTFLPVSYSIKTYLLIVLPQVILPSLLLCLLAGWRRWLWWVVFIFGNLLWLIEMGCYFIQGQRLWSYIALLVAQSNPSESGEFLSTMYPCFLKALFTTGVCAAVFYVCSRLWRGMSERLLMRLQGGRGRMIMKIAGLSLFLSVIYSPAMICHVASKDRGYERRISRIEDYSISCSWIMYAYALNDMFNNPDLKAIPKLVETMAHTEVGLDSAKDSLIFVYVIGESFPRCHSSLFGYPYPTNPLMAKELADSSLVTFSNVISRAHYTNGVYRYMLSTCDPQAPEPFERYPLLPAVMRKAGYEVAYFDNQSLISDGKRDLECSYFLNDKSVREYCFDTFNRELSDYDGDFVSANSPLTANKSLTIYHLMGQHATYGERYPAGFSRFSKDDYSRFEDLSEKGAIIMSEFDNATAYTDYVLHSLVDMLRDKTAVLIYSPDHGEEVFDYREAFSRQPEAPITSVRLLYEVPVMIWMSDSFRLKYPDIVSALRDNAGKAIYNSDLPHTILDIAGIKTATFNPDVSLIRGGDGRAHRHVLMHDIDYDASRREIYRQKLRYEQ